MMTCDSCVLQVMIGNAKYQCSCVRYMTRDNTALIAGLTVAIILLLIILIIVGILLYRRRRNKLVEEQVLENEKKTWTKQDNKEKQLFDDYGQPEIKEHCSRKLPDDYIKDGMQAKQQEMGDQYNRKLPDDYYEDEIPMEQQYSRGFPYDYD